MKHFSRMVEVSKLKGIMNDGDGYGTFLGSRDLKAITLFRAAVMSSEVFVFEPTDDPPMNVTDDHPLVKSGMLMDAPFPNFSIEMSRGSITIPRPNHQDAADLWIDCILCIEVEPAKYLFYCYGRLAVPVHGGARADEEVIILNSYMAPNVKLLLDRMKCERVGIEHVREKMKVGTGKDKRVRDVRRVIRVVPKKTYAKVQSSTSGRTIDWTHKWSVRGHWRKLPVGHKVGKNRSGEPLIGAGMTWVHEYEKGPKDRPSIKKVRFVENEVTA